MKKKGFTLVELIIIIVILGIILGISVPFISKMVDKAKRKAYFNSVSNIVNSLKWEDSSNYEYCLYDLSKSEDSEVDINSLYVIIYNKDGKEKYAVYSKYNDEEIGIDNSDFKSLSVDDMDNWVKTPGLDNIDKVEITDSLFKGESASELAGDLLDNPEKMYNMCTLKGATK